MSRNSFTIKHSVVIRRPAAAVWDHTQDYSKRPLWDASVKKAEVIKKSPQRTVKVWTSDGSEMTFIYKLDQRPHKTTLSTSNVSSPVIVSAGGSWVYEENDSATTWTQINTIVLKNGFLVKIFLPLFRLLFSSQIKKAMNKARKQLENSVSV